LVDGAAFWEVDGGGSAVVRLVAAFDGEELGELAGVGLTC
jgi:hypothetical protein